MSSYAHPRLSLGGVPIHAMFDPFPIACFTGALLTDFAYYKTATIQWANFSAWLLAFGLIMGAFSALFGLIDLFRLRRQDRPLIGWIHAGGSIIVLLLALLNSFVHARDGWTSVVPTGLTLSAITVLVLIVTGFLGHRMAYVPSYGERS